MTIRGLTAGAALVALTGSAAMAGMIRVSGQPTNGNALILKPSDLSSSVFGGNTPPNISNLVLSSIHTSLQGDGIATDGWVTILAAQTTHGLSLFALIDDENQPGNNSNLTGVIAFGSVITEVSGASVDTWKNDLGEFDIFPPGVAIVGSSRILTNNINFNWDHLERGDAFAASGLEVDDSGTWTFDPNAPGGNPALGVGNGFQYVSWNGSDWDVVGTGSFAPGFGQSALNWDVIIPLPTGGSLACAGLLFVGARRRRMA